MKIIILGAGAVGSTLAEKMAAERIDITLVDVWSERLHELQERNDIQVVQGVASHPDVLRTAGADDCDLLIAVTGSDEVNLVACQVAWSLFRTPLRLARIRSAAYVRHAPELFREQHIPLDHCILPETQVTEQIVHLINHPGALRMWDFADSRVHLVETVVDSDSEWGGQRLLDLNNALLINHNARIVSLYRDNQSILITPDTHLFPGDEPLFVSAEEQVDAVLGELRIPSTRKKRSTITIAGGGHVGEILASSLEKEHRVKLIEPDTIRCSQLAELLQKTIVLQGSAADANLLYAENVDATDVFCATTNNDEINVMSCLLAKRMGVKKTVALINKPDYAAMFPRGEGIDVVFSPHETTISMVLSYIRRGDVVRAHAVHSGNAEAIELVAHGERATSAVIGRLVATLELPKGVTLCALIRDEAVHYSFDGEDGGDSSPLVLEAGDHLVFFVADKDQVHDLEKMFQLPVVSF